MLLDNGSFGKFVSKAGCFGVDSTDVFLLNGKEHLKSLLSSNPWPSNWSRNLSTILLAFFSIFLDNLEVIIRNLFGS